MDERRDLVDREELRRRLKEERSKTTAYDEWHDGWRYGNCAAEIILKAMPAVECPRGWTRDEVLAELDADPDAVCEFLHPLSAEWGTVHPDDVRSWWHPEVRRYDVRVVRVAPEPEWVPLHEVIGRSLPHDASCDAHPPIVDVKSGSRWGIDGWFWTGAPFPHDDTTTPWTTLTVRSDGQVAVRPKAAT